MSQGAILQISYIGYISQEVTVTGQPLSIILLEDTKTLDEVVVVGYGTMRKKDLTGSVIQINPDKIADQNPSSVQDILRGTPGLQIGYDASAKGTNASILLRGQNSLGTSASPLIVLDGMAFYGELSEINPDDIGQIDVLKDASSAAIYGAKAAAGVIIISTKKGKSGKPVINVSTNWAVNNKSAYRDYFNANDYMRYREDWYMMNFTYGKGNDGFTVITERWTKMAAVGLSSGTLTTRIISALAIGTRGLLQQEKVASDLQKENLIKVCMLVVCN